MKRTLMITTLYELKIPKTKVGEEFIANFSYVDRGHLPYTHYNVYTIYKDKRGYIWLGTGALGLCCYDGKNLAGCMKNTHLVLVCNEDAMARRL